MRFCCSQLTAVTCVKDCKCGFAGAIAEHRTLFSTAGITKPVAVAGTGTVTITIAFTAGFTGVSIAS